jgi:hypothetical protein
MQKKGASKKVTSKKVVEKSKSSPKKGKEVEKKSEVS